MEYSVWDDMVASHHPVECIEFANSYYREDWMLLVHLHLLQKHYTRYQNVPKSD